MKRKRPAAGAADDNDSVGEDSTNGSSGSGFSRHRRAGNDEDDDDYDGQRPAFAVGDDDADDADEEEAVDADARAATAALVSASAQPLPKPLSAAHGASAPPASAEEYLKLVRREARRCPPVVISNINPRLYDQKQTTGYLPKIERSQKCAAHLLPNAEWERNFASDFADLRQALIRYNAQSRSTSSTSSTSSCASAVPPVSSEASTANARPRFPVKSDSAGWVRFCLGAEYVYVRPAHETRQRQHHRQLTGVLPPEEDPPEAPAAHAAYAASDPAAATTSSASASAAASAASAGPSDSLASFASAAKAPLLTLMRHFDHQKTRSLLMTLIDYLNAHVTAQRADDPPAPPPTPASDTKTTATTATAPALAASNSGSASASVSTAATEAGAGAGVDADSEQRVWPLTPLLSVWLYALLAKSEKPIDMSAAASLRTLYRDLTALRTKMTTGSELALARINILLTIVHHCFGQKVDTD